MKKLLLLTDFSKNARSATDNALQLGIWPQADILLVNSILQNRKIINNDGV